MAIDAGPDPVGTFYGNAYDQRGTPWVRIAEGISDIGAYEAQADPTPTTTPPTTTTTAGGDPVVPEFTG